MKVYFKESQFPEAAKYSKPNPTLMLNTPIEYIPSDKNLVVVAEDEGDQSDFLSFYDEITRYIEYIISMIIDDTGEYYIALLEEMGNENIPQLLFSRVFKFEGVDWLEV